MKLDGRSVAFLHRVTAFLDYEADLLDRHEFREWLALWNQSGRYVVPVERDTTDFESKLNHIFDDHTMRLQRIDRLLSGHAPSASPITRTVRTVSRVRLLGREGNKLLVSSALLIVSYKRQVQKMFAADVTHRLDIDGVSGPVQIMEKVVRLINSDEPLCHMSFLL